MTSAFGIDVSEEQVQRAQESGMTNVVRADALEFLGGSPDSWDCITTTDVLEHFTHDEVVALTGAIASALREGGTWVAQVPNATSPFFGNYAYGDFTHRTVFTVRSMQQIARLVGLVPVGAFPVGPPTGGGLKRTARRITYTVGAAAMKAFLASETGQWSGLVVSQNLVFVAAKSVDTPAVEVGNGHA
jgi:2-polyprenyl-3-methyl-5-hydroxy-6-metoxy-1,4-benzoquinol methylase